MSACFMFQVLSIDKGAEPNWEAGEKEINRLLGVHLVNWSSDYLESYLDEWAGSDKTVADPDMNDRTAAVETLRKELESLRQAWHNDFQDAATFEVGNKEVLVTGGMSYSDPPTETYTTIQRLFYAGISRACGFDF
jgi:hypothetical protein